MNSAICIVEMVGPSSRHAKPCLKLRSVCLSFFMHFASPLSLELFFFTMECGETSTQDTVCVTLVPGHVGRHGQAVSLFSEASSARAWGACVLDQSA
ncbi:hypothetical protein VNO80_13145 [Phaseolus coccineus]|uniref:Uncharacterized protein n=1 Tax=Phaseolus coccineus TaxID=3886 RepID=A0AAN9N683_PHACN